MQITRKRIKKISACYTLEGPILDNVQNIKYLGITIFEMEHTSAIIAQMLILRRKWRHVHMTLKSQHTRDWYGQSWSMVIKLGTPKYTSSG